MYYTYLSPDTNQFEIDIIKTIFYINKSERKIIWIDFYKSIWTSNHRVHYGKLHNRDIF